MACKNCEGLQRSLEGCRELGQLGRQQSDLLREALEKEQAKPTVEELLDIASTLAQIASRLEKAFPGGGLLPDEASSVALMALKQLRKRLADEERDGK